MFSPIVASCCRFTSTGSCLSSCIGLSCGKDDDCATGEYCCGMYSKKCSRSCVGARCRSDTDCSAGQCCDDTTRCTAEKCDSGEKSLSVPRFVVGILVPFVVVVVFICVSCRAAKRKAARESHQTNENIQLGTTRTVEQQESDERQPQQQQQEPRPSLNTENSDNPPPPPYPGEPPPAYTTLFPVPPTYPESNPTP